MMAKRKRPDLAQPQNPQSNTSVEDPREEDHEQHDTEISDGGLDAAASIGEPEPNAELAAPTEGDTPKGGDVGSKGSRSPKPNASRQVVKPTSLSSFFSIVVPYLQVAVVVPQDSRAREALRQITGVCKKKSIKVKQVSSSLGDPALANLFRQSCCVIVMDPEKELELIVKALCSSRPVVSLNGRNHDIQGVIPGSIETLDYTVIHCKKLASISCNQNNFRSLGLNLNEHPTVG